MLRDYQQQSVDSIYSYFESNGGNPVIEAPTAAGKSWIIAGFIKSVLQQYPDQRILMLTHVKELIEQNAEKLLIAWPDAPLGINSAGIGIRDTDAPVLYAGIQSIYNRASEIGWTDLIIIDECHLVNHDDNGMYRRFLRAMTAINPMIKVIGVTATPYRTGHGYITDGNSRIFTDICHKIEIDYLLDQGYLSPLTSKKTAAQIDVSGVGLRAGDFIHSELEELLDDETLLDAATDEIIQIARDQGRKTWLVFCAGVVNAERTRDMMRDKGVICESITGDTPKKDRARILKAYKAGRIQCLTNANVLTTGFDAPRIDLIAFLRPTASLILYIQMAGRGMRLSPETGKENCLILDFAGNVLRHGPVNRVKPRRIRKGEEPGEAPTKVCPECDEIIHAPVMLCPMCGYEFPRKPKHQSTAAELDILAASGDQSQWMSVTRVGYQKHSKPGKPDSMRVDYFCGLSRYSKWLCFDHPGYAQTVARQHWLKHGGYMPIPDSTAEALSRSGELFEPIKIKVDLSNKYPEIKKYELPEQVA